jgi:hypothetical protein
MSWHDCHIGYYIVFLVCLALAYLSQSPSLAIIGFAAMLNGAYAVAFTVHENGDYSNFVWWLALPTSVLALFIAVMLEVNLGEKDGVGLGETIALCIVAKLAVGQLMFLFRRRRERLALQFVQVTDERTS